jgi:hypothetical protein
MDQERGGWQRTDPSDDAERGEYEVGTREYNPEYDTTLDDTTPDEYDTTTMGAQQGEMARLVAAVENDPDSLVQEILNGTVQLSAEQVNVLIAYARQVKAENLVAVLQQMF